MNALTESWKLDEFFCAMIAQCCRQDAAKIHAHTTLLELGIDSLTFVALLSQVEAIHDITFEPESVLSLMEAPTIASLVQRIEELVRASATRHVS